MDLPEDNVLEKLNKVSTAKRQAYMVSKQRTGSYIEPNMLHRSYSTQSLGKGKRSTRQRQPESIASIIWIAPTDQIRRKFPRCRRRRCGADSLINTLAVLRLFGELGFRLRPMFLAIELNHTAEGPY